MRKTKNNNPLVSIIIPVYNAGDFLVEAIESIRNQTIKNWELICINDGSTDTSKKILERYAKKDKRIKVFHFPKNTGLAHALNLGVNKAKGYYLARMDADDISMPKRLEKQIIYLKNNPLAVAVGSQVKLINEKGRFLGYKKFPTDPEKIYQLMFTMMAIQHPTLLTYTRLMVKCHYANHSTAEDVSMFFKLLRYGNFINTKEVLFNYRIRQNSNSLKDPKKTFYLTLKSRIKAVVNWGYEPSLLDILINMVQLLLISVLPSFLILRLYETIRFDNPVNKIVRLKKKLVGYFTFKKHRPAFFVK